MGFVKIYIYFLALDSTLNTKSDFIFSLLDVHFEGTLNGITTYGVERGIEKKGSVYLVMKDMVFLWLFE